MGRGRTTTGMIAASLIATIARDGTSDEVYETDEETEGEDDDVDLDEAAQYLNGEHSPVRCADGRRVQDHPPARHGPTTRQGGQAPYRPRDQRHGWRAELTQGGVRVGSSTLAAAHTSFKLKVAAAEPGTPKYNTLLHQGVNYLYRCEWRASASGRYES